MPAISSVLNCYASCCAWNGPNPSRHPEQMASGWNDVAPDTAESANYTSHLQMAPLYAIPPETWTSPEVRRSARSLAGETGQKFPISKLHLRPGDVKNFPHGAIRAESRALREFAQGRRKKEPEARSPDYFPTAVSIQSQKAPTFARYLFLEIRT